MSDMRNILETVEKHGEKMGMCLMLRLWANSLTNAMTRMPQQTKQDTASSLRLDWELAKSLVDGKATPALPDTTHPGWDKLERGIENAELMTVGYDPGGAEHHGDDVYQTDR